VATAEYRADSDDVARFLRDCCTIGPDHVAGASDLFDVFRDYGGTLSQRKFTDELQDRGFAKRPHGGSRRIHYFGLGVKVNV